VTAQENPAPTEKPKLSERDEPVKIDLDPEEALRALLQVDPDAPPVEPEE
jgi:hypothetical protein